MTLNIPSDIGRFLFNSGWFTNDGTTYSNYNHSVTLDPSIIEIIDIFYMKGFQEGALKSLHVIELDDNNEIF